MTAHAVDPAAAADLVMTERVVSQPKVLHSRIADYQELFKVRVTSMVVLTAWAGFYLGSMRSGITSMHWGLVQSLLGITLISCGASVLNQVIERKTDAKMVRTAQRPVAAGRFGLAAGMALGLACFAVGAVVLAWFTNPVTVMLTLLTGFIYVAVYTPLKRYTTLATFIGAFPGAMPPLLGWTAARGVIEWPAVALFAILFVWQFPHFMAIAWMYREDYARAGYLTLPAGKQRDRFAIWQSLAPSVALLAVSFVPAITGESGLVYSVAALICGSIFLYYSTHFAFRRSNLAARQLLTASIVYLPLVFMSMTLDKK
jgi:protoheme IX farnesyltransferase